MFEGWAGQGIAAVLTALLLVGIRNEWDLVTWLAPKSEDPLQIETGSSSG